MALLYTMKDGVLPKERYTFVNIKARNVEKGFSEIIY